MEEQSEKLQNELALQYMESFLDSMNSLGYTAQEAVSVLREHVNKN